MKRYSSNEITAIPEVLKFLELNGCILMIDAMGCQRNIAKKIIEKKSDYCETNERGHGQEEKRRYWITGGIGYLTDRGFLGPIFRSFQLDTAGSTNNDFLGKIKIRWLYK